MSDRERWEERHRAALGAPPGAPSAWVMERARSLGARGTALDLACGRGRHAVPLAAAGWRVIAVDIAEAAVRASRAAGAGSGRRVEGVVADAGALPVRAGAIDLIVCVSFLDRAVFGHLSHLLRPGGALLCEIFTEAQRTLGRGPRSSAHLLRSGELPSLARALRVTEYTEGLVRDASGERYVARMQAVNG
ncbi:MAG TPA: class I SAM-dependent methyltransferase [Gemmatimonadaceae bacterium]